MDVSVILCTCNRNRKLFEAVRSVLENSYTDFELLLIDQSTTTTTGDLIREAFSADPRLRYVHIKRTGASRGRNRGIALARGDLLIFTDDDVVVSRNWISEHVACHRSFQRRGVPVGVIGGPIRGIWEVPRPLWWPDEFLYAVTEFGIEPGRTELEGGDLPLGANYSCSKALIERVGGFDSRMGGIVGRSALLTIPGEETLVALRIGAQGFEPRFCPAAEVNHWMPKERLTTRYFAVRLFQQGAGDLVTALRLGNGKWGTLCRPIAKRLARTIKAFLRLTVGAGIRPSNWKGPAWYGEFGHLLLGAGGLWGLLTWPLLSLADPES